MPGMVRFLHPNGSVLGQCETYRSLNLLAHAQVAEVGVGSVCGGHGRCGKDRVRVVFAAEQNANLNAPTAEERSHLSAAELSQGFRLACQVFPGSDGCSVDAVVSAAGAATHQS